eukprot:CAMPEP_0174951672 /NCGR_PEP_ID=MMETSP1355-20121228/94973_1 /TAXON_ID=464990 /ORGANISM="Hemiselmis tepida, Strain CCMP443" /LENGTH=843 /DNA_ID=CAMNT_0016199347 /DNA_START=360 /DNA_END=2891 /DNA_ORIENTATION=+
MFPLHLVGVSRIHLLLVVLLIVLCQGVSFGGQGVPCTQKGLIERDNPHLINGAIAADWAGTVRPSLRDAHGVHATGSLRDDQAPEQRMVEGQRVAGLSLLRCRGGAKRQRERGKKRLQAESGESGDTKEEQLSAPRWRKRWVIDRLERAERELDEAEAADPVNPLRVAKAELGVAQAELKAAPEGEKAGLQVQVAKAELGVAETRWQAAPEAEKAEFLKGIDLARKTYQLLLDTSTVTPKKGPFLPKHLQDTLSELQNTPLPDAGTTIIPVGVGEFEQLSTGGYYYVDKTGYIKGLVQRDKRIFLSRPRKFGKSMVVSMLKWFFSGKHGYRLFEGLDVTRDPPSIMRKVQWGPDMEPFGLIALDFSELKHSKGADELEQSLVRALVSVGQSYGISIERTNAKEALKQLVETLAHDPRNHQRKVVVLIDEYDAPIISILEDLNEHAMEAAEANRAVLAEFFTMLKALGSFVAFEFVTGVSKVSKTSLFSGANYLVDVTLDRRCSTLCGFTWDEIERSFGDSLNMICAQDGCADLSELHERIMSWYNGYMWSDGDSAARVLNPHSVCSLLSSQKFKQFWIVAGRSTFLTKLMANEPERWAAMTEDSEIDRSSMLSNVDVSVTLTDSNVQSLLFQTGYLTVKECIGDKLILTVPNEEVKASLYPELWKSIFGGPVSKTVVTEPVVKALLDNRLETFLTSMNAVFNSLPYQASVRYADQYEGFYHCILLTLLRDMRISVEGERSTAKGRSDCRIDTGKYLYYIEVKVLTTERISKTLLNTTLQRAVNQIFERDYCGGDRDGPNRECLAVSIVFSSAKRMAVGMRVQKFSYTQGMKVERSGGYQDFQV